MKICYLCAIPLTVSAGQTNLTGSATPNEGAVLSTSLLTAPDIKINYELNEVSSPIGVPLEFLRDQILKKTKGSI